ncbi:MAG TPA: PEP/pyruvate-binding domain-containing protein [Nitrospira sp.]|nr:PEP/pyruvate-binding domain-containing protein [Nitrospira sp.]
MERPPVLPLAACTDSALAGGKARGLARLIAVGARVPPGLCATTALYREFLRQAGLTADVDVLLAARLSGNDRLPLARDLRSRIQKAPWPRELYHQLETAVLGLGFNDATLWAVRSSATNEDATQASFAGLYRTHLGVRFSGIFAAVQDIWSSLWEERVLAYPRKTAVAASPPEMAVVIQPMLDATVAGVAYSIDPVTGENHVVVNALPGLGAPLVDGTVTPDHYVVRTDASLAAGAAVVKRSVAAKSSALRLGSDGVRTEPLPRDAGASSSMSDRQLTELAGVTKRIETLFGYPVDVEWAVDRQGLWLLQARPVTVVVRSGQTSAGGWEWSRANLKETMPEVPSPIGVSFLERFMDVYIIAHYRRLGCRIPEGAFATRTFHGRPYINSTLFHSLILQLGGDPSLNAEQMGGEPVLAVPSEPVLGPLVRLRAAWLMWREMKRAASDASRSFADMKQQALRYQPDKIRDWDPGELDRHLEELGRWLDRYEMTFGIVLGVGQCLQTFSTLLPGWLGEDWRGVLNSALQGEGTVISAQQIHRVAELVEAARQDEALSHGLLSEGWDLARLRHHAPRSPFLALFDRHLEEFGHRGTGESDVMSPRFADRPDIVLDVVRVQLSGPVVRPEDVVARQRATRAAALATIRARLGWRLDRLTVFLWCYRRLRRYLALREANRHHLMYYSTAVRNLLLRFGAGLAARGTLDAPDDVFYLTLEERAFILSATEGDWKETVRTRKADRARWLAMQVPDTIRSSEDKTGRGDQTAGPADGCLRGTPISTGTATGPACLVRSMADWPKVRPGDIIVAPVIDPGLAPLFGIAAGLVAEMGGTLSHGAIIAREYGLPAVANVPGAISLLKDGQRVRLNGGSGQVQIDSGAGS